MSRSAVSTRLGDDFGFTTKITNQGRRTLTGLVAHLNVVGLSSGIYVDPGGLVLGAHEERADARARRVHLHLLVRDGGHRRARGRLRRRAAGGPGPTAQPASSPAIDVRIADTKDLNSGGVLPLALGVPALLGLLTLATRRRRTR